MKKIVLNNQSILDLAIQHTGTVENSFDIALANGISVSDSLETGTQINIADSVKKKNDVLNYYTTKNYRPATEGINDIEIKPLKGIGYWVIGETFIVQ